MANKDQGGPPGDKPLTTHVVSAPQRALTPIEKVKVTLASKDQHNALLNLLGSEDEVRRFQTSAIEYVSRSPKLLLTDKTSLIMALIQVAQFRFLPSGVSGEAFIIPYGKEAKFQLGYKGIVTLLFRAGYISGITAEIVHENDEFEYEAGLTPKLVHKRPKFGTPRGEAIGVYTIVQMRDGSKTYHVMEKEEVMKIKAMSKGAASKDSPWNTGDPLKAMWKKTCLIQHGKFLPQTPDLSRALEIDYEGSGMEKPKFDAQGPATARASHAPAAPADTRDVEAVEVGDTKEGENQTLPPEELCPAGKHPKSEVDADGDCKKCVAEALEKEGGETVIEA